MSPNGIRIYYSKTDDVDKILRRVISYYGGPVWSPAYRASFYLKANLVGIEELLDNDAYAKSISDNSYRYAVCVDTTNSRKLRQLIRSRQREYCPWCNIQFIEYQTICCGLNRRQFLK